jgi:hypothetical protein
MTRVNPTSKLHQLGSFFVYHSLLLKQGQPSPPGYYSAGQWKVRRRHKDGFLLSEPNKSYKGKERISYCYIKKMRCQVKAPNLILQSLRSCGSGFMLGSKLHITWNLWPTIQGSITKTSDSNAVLGSVTDIQKLEESTSHEFLSREFFCIDIVHVYEQ